MTTQPSPELIGGYQLLAKLGEGGMGVVHLARRPGGDRVALKILRPAVVGDDEARNRLAREVSSLQRIRSRWVAEIVDADPWAPVPYVATRYVPGLSLHDHVVEEGPITGRDLVWFAGCLAEGVASVHGCGVLHRDIKPSNVLMEGRTPILIDFGLARVADDPKLTHTGWLLGTPGYLAPEILYGDDASDASDVHSWAASVVYAGTGRPPYGRGPAMAIMDRVRRGEHDLTGLPDDLARLLDAALAPDPADRPTLEEILDWLRPQTTAPHLRPVPLEDAVPATVPLAAVHREALDDGTVHLAPQAPAAAAPAPGTRAYTQYAPPAAPLAPQAQPYGQPYEQPYAQPYEQQPYAQPYAQPFDPWSQEPEPATPYVPPLERARRGALLIALAAVVAAWTAAFPWPTTLLALLAVWLLRSGSLAASAVGDRRRLRGRRWYDGVRFLVSAPWHLVRSIPSTAMLQLWALGIAASGALVCYAVAADISTTLAVMGGLFAVAAYAGPGGSRVRSPLARAVVPLAGRSGPWSIGFGVLVAAALLGGVMVVADGVSWTPDDSRPFPGQRLHLPGAVAR